MANPTIPTGDLLFLLPLLDILLTLTEVTDTTAKVYSNPIPNFCPRKTLRWHKMPSHLLQKQTTIKHESIAENMN